MLERGLNGARAPIALADHLVDFAAPSGYQRKLGSDKKGVQGDQAKHGNHAAGSRGYRRGIHGVRSKKSKDHMRVIYIVVEIRLTPGAYN
jgi:hypothetical protein